ncbi:baseplate protein J [Serratia phage vB_SmaM-ChuuTotoro]|nr:baseplate protein J [Serratia phage vB_SmaM-ChuuTotoro]
MANDVKYGLTDAGFELPAFADLAAETKAALKAVFGENFNTQSNSIADKFTSIYSEREYQLWALMADVYSAQTIHGAEGIYLDDLLAKRGVFRKGKTKGTGQVEMTVDSTVPYNMVYTQAAYTIDDGNFEFSRDTQVAGNIIAMEITNPMWSVGTYRLTIQNMNDQSTKTFTYNLTNKTPNNPVLNTFMSNIKRFIVENTILENENRIIIDTNSGGMRIGYDSAGNMIGLTSRVDLRFTPLVGNKTITLDCIAVDAGDISRESNSIRSISPTPAGFVSITNLRAFTDGSDVETDNEYKIRALTIATQGKATRSAVLSALRDNVEGLEKVRIFNNNTGQTNALGIPAYRYLTVCYGGTTEQISRVLYDTQALSNNTYGDVYFDVQTEDGEEERIYHSKADSRPLAVRVKYQGRPIAMTEEQDIAAGIKQIVDSLNISDTLYNIQLVSAVGISVNAGRFTKIIVEVKDRDAPDTEYTSADFTAQYNQLFSLSLEDVTFSQII